MRGHNRLATLPAPDTLLDITGNLLAGRWSTIALWTVTT